jgi:hypothetical protein
LPSDEPVGALEAVAHFHGAVPTGVAAPLRSRIFVNHPKWGDGVRFTVAEPRDGEAVAFPDEAFNRTNGNEHAAALVSAQSVAVDPADRLWLLDTGGPMFQPTKHGGPKLVCVDLSTDKVAKKILFPTDAALPATYLDDVRLDLRRGEGGVASITGSADKGPNGIIVVDPATGESWRRGPPPVAGRHVGRGGRPPLRHGEPAPPPSQVPGRRGRAAQAPHAVPRPRRGGAGPPALIRGSPARAGGRRPAPGACPRRNPRLGPSRHPW